MDPGSNPTRDIWSVDSRQNLKYLFVFCFFLGLLVNSIHPTKNQQEEAPEQEINASNQYKTVIRNLDEELLKSKHYQEFLEKKNTMFNVNYN